MSDFVLRVPNLQTWLLGFVLILRSASGGPLPAALARGAAGGDVPVCTDGPWHWEGDTWVCFLCLHKFCCRLGVLYFRLGVCGGGIGYPTVLKC